MPLKRSEALQPLSRQHHNALLFCLLLQKGIKKNANAEVMQNFIQQFWYKDLQRHFELEEQYFYPLKNNYPQLNDGLNKMMNDHYELKNIINEISLNPTLISINELQQKLEAHVRFEERQLFPFIEAAISLQEQMILGKIIEKEKEESCLNYSTRFWE